MLPIKMAMLKERRSINFVGKTTTPKVSLQHNVSSQHRSDNLAQLNTLAVITCYDTDSNNKLTFI